MNPQRRTYYGVRWYIAHQLKRDERRLATQGYTVASETYIPGARLLRVDSVAEGRQPQRQQLGHRREPRLHSGLREGQEGDSVPTEAGTFDSRCVPEGDTGRRALSDASASRRTARQASEWTGPACSFRYRHRMGRRCCRFTTTAVKRSRDAGGSSIRGRRRISGGA